VRLTLLFRYDTIFAISNAVTEDAPRKRFLQRASGWWKEAKAAPVRYRFPSGGLE
jgi:hypothetical protein